MHRLLLLIPLLVAPILTPAQAQHHGHGGRGHGAMPLSAPGHDIFGTVQEAIQALEADSTTDWSEVDMEALRQHLIDMHHVAMHVVVEESTPIDGGVRLAVRPTSDSADAALQRVLDVHPTMLQHQEGWEMTVTEETNRYILRVTDPSGTDADKIRGLGYIGLLAYGPHHQHHHWMMVQGNTPHAN
jgi:hypothetical protein